MKTVRGYQEEHGDTGADHWVRDFEARLRQSMPTPLPVGEGRTLVGVVHSGGYDAAERQLKINRRAMQAGEQELEDDGH